MSSMAQRHQQHYQDDEARNRASGDDSNIVDGPAPSVTPRRRHRVCISTTRLDMTVTTTTVTLRRRALPHG